MKYPAGALARAGGMTFHKRNRNSIMAKSSVSAEFVPEDYPSSGLVIPDRQGIFGVRFTIEGERQIQAAIDEEEGEIYDNEDDGDRLESSERIMR
jgi:hypothetical protein